MLQSAVQSGRSQLAGAGPHQRLLPLAHGVHAEAHKNRRLRVGTGFYINPTPPEEAASFCAKQTRRAEYGRSRLKYGSASSLQQRNDGASSRAFRVFQFNLQSSLDSRSSGSTTISQAAICPSVCTVKAQFADSQSAVGLHGRAKRAARQGTSLIQTHNPVSGSSTGQGSSLPNSENVLPPPGFHRACLFSHCREIPATTA